GAAQRLEPLSSSRRCGTAIIMRTDMRQWPVAALRKSLARLLTFSIAILLFSAPGLAQSAVGGLHGQVLDPTGAVIPDADIAIKSENGRTVKTKSDGVGSYSVKNLTPGKYSLTVSEKGFRPNVQEVDVAAGQDKKLNFTLEVFVEEEHVDVQSDAARVNVNPESNSNSLVLSGKDLDALSDDPDELQSELQALAGPSAGPNGGQVYIDGFTGGQLPPKSSIREIRINSNPFSAQYDKLGYGRIEIFTKPGTDKLHGSAMMMGNDSAFNSLNPFVKSEPAYHTLNSMANAG